MTVTYTTAEKVGAIMQFNQPAGFTSTTKPSASQVEEMINRAEDYIDKITNNAWRVANVSDEYHDVIHEYSYDVGIPIFLAHRNIKQFSNADGDKLEVWNGSTYENWLVTRTEGRNRDFWIDYNKGVVYLRNVYWLYRPLQLRVTYRYGENAVNKIAEDAATKLVAIDILQSWDLLAGVPEGLDRNTIQNKIDNFKKSADADIESLTEFVVAKI